MTDAAQLNDRRAHPRLRVPGTVSIEHSGTRLRGKVENISLGGLGVSLPTPLPVGAEVPTDIPLPEGGFVSVRASVVHSADGLIGLRFMWAGKGDQLRHVLRADLMESEVRLLSEGTAAAAGGRRLWRREAERVALSLPVHWGADEACVHRGLVTSLSTKGALIEGRLVSLPHDRLYLRLPDGAGGHLRLTCEIVYYVSGAGVAVQFVDLTMGQREGLLALVEYHRSLVTPPRP